MEKQGKCSTSNEQAIVLLKKIRLVDITREFGIQHGLSSKGLNSCQEQLLAVASYLESSSSLDSSSGVAVGKQEDALVVVDPNIISAGDVDIKEEHYYEEDPSCADQDNQLAKVKEEASTEGESRHGAAALNVMKLDGQDETFDDYRGINFDGTDLTLHIKNASYVFLPTYQEKKRFSCSKCSYSTNLKNNLQKHERKHDVEMYKFACPFCPYKTYLKNKLNRHLPTHDLNVEKNLLCGLCPFKTFNTDRLNVHLRRHDPVYSTRFSCSQCPFKTGCKGKLTKHCLTHVRDQAKRLSCPHCHYRTDGTQNLKRHLKIWHKSITGNGSSA